MVRGYRTLERAGGRPAGRSTGFDPESDRPGSAVALPRVDHRRSKALVPKPHWRTTIAARPLRIALDGISFGTSRRPGRGDQSSGGADTPSPESTAGGIPTVSAAVSRSPFQEG